jgi:hypothetical protein
MMCSDVRTVRASTMPRKLAATSESQLQKFHTEYRGMMELDSHADTCTLGANVRAIAYTEMVCSVLPYHPGYQAQSDVPVVQAVTTYTDQETGESYILVINQALYMGDTLPASLISPFQLQSHGIIVDDCPKHLSPNPSHTSHLIYIPKVDLRIPLQLQGVVSCFPTHFPSNYELNHYPWIELTSDNEWDPNDKRFQEWEERLDHILDVLDEEFFPHQIDCTICELWAIQSSFSFLQFICNKLASAVKVSATKSSPQRHSESLRDEISQIFGVGLDTATRTLNATTQLAIRNSIHPIHKRFRTEVAQLRYPRLGGLHRKFHTDTFFASQPSLSRCTMGQMYINDIDFTKFYPKKIKSEAPDTLISFMQDIGIPSDLHSDDAKELSEGCMGELLCKFWIRGSQSEPYSPWQVRAELCIREVKKAV